MHWNVFLLWTMTTGPFFPNSSRCSNLQTARYDFLWPTTCKNYIRTKRKKKAFTKFSPSLNHQRQTELMLIYSGQINETPAHHFYFPGRLGYRRFRGLPRPTQGTIVSGAQTFRVAGGLSRCSDEQFRCS